MVDWFTEISDQKINASVTLIAKNGKIDPKDWYAGSMRNISVRVNHLRPNTFFLAQVQVIDSETFEPVHESNNKVIAGECQILFKSDQRVTTTATERSTNTFNLNVRFVQSSSSYSRKGRLPGSPKDKNQTTFKRFRIRVLLYEIVQDDEESSLLLPFSSRLLSKALCIFESPSLQTKANCTARQFGVKNSDPTRLVLSILSGAITVCSKRNGL